MTRRWRGSIIIEASVATALFAVGIMVIYIGFFQAHRISRRNQETLAALNLINSQIEVDSAAQYPSLNDSHPALLPSNNIGLPNAVFSRDVVHDSTNEIKTILYIVSWAGPNGSGTVTVEHEVTRDGLANN